MRKIFLLFYLSLAVCSYSQNSNFGVWTTIGAEKKINKKLSLDADLEMRTRDNIKSVDRWSGTVDMSYNLYKFIKVGGSYSYLYSQKEKEVTTKGNIIPEYWYSRHRFSLYVTGKYNIDKLTISLREKWQYTYRPEKFVAKFDDDGQTPKSDEHVKGKGENMLRSRFQLDYDVFKNLINPYASIEMYHDKKGLEKIRYTIGTSIKADKRNEFDLFYRYQDKAADDEASGHVLGLGYKYKF